MSNNQFTDRNGINLVNTIFTSVFKWYFRELPILDIGIDAVIEPTVDHKSEAFCLAGLQVKTGEGNFSKGKLGYVYYASSRHYKYWTESTVPVFLIAAFPNQEKAYWEVLDKDKFTPLEKSHKILIPFANELNEGSIEEFQSIITEHFESYYLKTYDEWSKNKNLSPLDYTALIREAFKEVALSAMRLKNTMEDTRTGINSIQEVIEEYIANDVGHESPRGKRLIRRLAKELTKFRLLLKTEYEFLNDSFEEAIQLFLDYTRLFIDFNDKQGSDRREIVESPLNDLLWLINEGKEIQETILSAIEELVDLRDVSPDVRKSRSAIRKFLLRNMKIYDGYTGKVMRFIKDLMQRRT